MGIRELRDKYGKNLKRRQAVNAAIRGEMVGGDDLLDAMPLVDRLTARLRERDLAGIDEAQAALDHLRTLRDLMASIIAQRYALAESRD